MVTNKDDVKVVFESEMTDSRLLKKPLISFKDEGVIIGAYDLHTIEKDMRFVDKPKAHWEWGIVINKGLEPSQFVKRVNLSMWYQSEVVRDKRYDRMVKLLKAEGLTFIVI